MNRKAEGITNLIAVTTARICADLEALGSLGKTLENLTLEEHDLMTLDEWGQHKETAEKAQDRRAEGLRVLGLIPRYVPHPSASFAAGVAKAPGPRPKQRRPNAIRHPAPGGKGTGS
jgi:hypothetical protein